MVALWMLWAAVALQQAWRRGWMHGPRTVAWPLDLFGDQVLLACGMLVSSLAASGVAAALGAKPGSPPSPTVSFWAIVVSSGVTIAAWLALRDSRSRAAVNSPPHTTFGRACIAGLAGLLVTWPLVSLVTLAGSWAQRLLGGPPTPESGHQTLDLLRTHAGETSAWALGLAVVLLSPLVEELVWRGAVQQALKALGFPRLAAIVTTATLFALIHWSAVPPDARLSALPALALLGVTLGWLMERCGRIAAPWAAHAAFNLSNLLLFSMLPG